MDEKKFSLIVLTFIFAVAISSTVFLFSASSNTGAYTAPKIYTNLEGNPLPYGYGYRGPYAPIMISESEIDFYEKKYPTQVPFEKPGYGFIPDRPEDTRQIFSYMQQSCPAGYRHIPAYKVAMYESRGFKIQKIGDTFCWKQESMV